MLRRLVNAIQQLAVLTLFCAAPAACVTEGVDPEKLAQVEEAGEPDTGEATSELRQVGMPCSSTCQCVGWAICDDGECKVSDPFGLTQEGQLCVLSCQCPYPKTCVYEGQSYGTCQSPGGSCNSDCDCGVKQVCINNTCWADFGPYPECRCDEHCPAGDVCVGHVCQ